jgi:hypothetical protein
MPVRIPPAAEQAAPTLEELFGLDTSQSSASAPLDNIPPQAEGHVPPTLPPEGLPEAADNMSETAVTQLTAHVDWLLSSSNTEVQAVVEQTASQLGSQFNFDRLPQAAVDNLDDVDFVQLAQSISAISDPLSHIPPQAEGHVPPGLPPDGLPQTAIDNMDDTAVTQLTTHVDWLFG